MRRVAQKLVGAVEPPEIAKVKMPDTVTTDATKVMAKVAKTVDSKPTNIPVVNASMSVASAKGQKIERAVARNISKEQAE